MDKKESLNANFLFYLIRKIRGMYYENKIT